MRFILRNIVISVIFLLITSCANQESKKNISSTENQQETLIDSVANLCNKCMNKHDINNPDYVPPCDGGINGKWCNNRHKILTNDSNCYFRKGNQKK